MEPDSGALFEYERDVMVSQQIEARGVNDARVLRAMRSVPRHAFVPESLTHHAYDDSPLPIGHHQTISQPYIVAYMAQQLHLKHTDRVLELGTGSGYQTAVLAALAGSVYSIEIVSELALIAKDRIRQLGLDSVQIQLGDGGHGWPEEAPFDAIILSAAARTIPPPLLEQMSLGGRLLAPLGDVSQQLVRITRSEDGWQTENLLAVRFVPFTGYWQ